MSADLKSATESNHATIVLIAEDEQLVRDVISRTLIAGGYSVIAAKDGDEALQRFTERHDEISLAVIDVVMPKMNGREVYERMRQLEPEIRVVFCTGYDPQAPEFDVVSLDVRRVRLLRKPVSPQVLLREIQQALDLD